MLAIHSKRLKEVRLRLKLTRMSVQDHTGIHHKTLAGYENGVSKPDYETLAKLCNLYEVSTDWVLGHTNNPNGNLETSERDLVQNIELNDDSLLSVPMMMDGRELTGTEKKKVLDLARLLLKKDQ